MSPVFLDQSHKNEKVTLRTDGLHGEKRCAAAGCLQQVARGHQVSKAFVPPQFSGQLDCNSLLSQIQNDTLIRS
eukprot:SAG31_NODE_2331_length_5931_cov_4.533093_4_plen_74_part_00